jgi:hypothetical protein
MKPAFFGVLLAAAVAFPATADPVGAQIRAALGAYEAGDMAGATGGLAQALAEIAARQAESLAAHLPEPPAGWTRAVEPDMAAIVVLLGGGVGAEAVYAGDGQRLHLTLLADNPAVAAMRQALTDPQPTADTGVVQIGSVTFVDEDGGLTALVADRILVQARGAAPEAMAAVLASMDFAALARWGS